MGAMIWAVIGSCLGSTGLFTLLGQIIRNRQEKNDKKDTLRKEVQELRKEQQELRKDVKRLERDSCRTQLLLMMRDYPDERAEILQLGAHYFGDLDGNWYLSSLFAAWIKKQGIEKPDWFDKEARE